MDDTPTVLPPGEVLAPAPQPVADAGVFPAGSPPTEPDDPARRQQAAHRFGMLNAFVDSGMSDLSRLEALTWLVLFRDARGNVATTSADYIARRIGASRRGVTKALGVLKAKGFVKVERHGGLNRGANTYRIEPRGN